MKGFVMKSGRRLWMFLVSLIVLVGISACGGGGGDTTPPSSTPSVKYSFWKGDIENYYSILDMNDQPLHRVVGKPYMVYQYDPLNGDILSVEFGLSEARNEYLPGVEAPIPEPFLGTDGLLYAERLGLKGPIDLLSIWKKVDDSSTEWIFSIDKGEDMWGHEILHFTRDNVSMWGEIINETAVWGGRVSDPNAFSLLHKFDSTTIDN